MPTHRILLLEDDDSLSRGISLKLQKEGHEAVTARTLTEARDAFSAQPPIDLVICDVGLPDGSGLDFCRWVRRHSDVLFLFLTALDTEIDIVSGYDVGADDYLTKPFSLMVLMSKVEAMLRRVGDRQSGDRVILCGNIAYHPTQNRFVKGDLPLVLSANEHKLLAFFMMHPKHVLSRQQLLDCLYEVGGDYVDDNTLAVNIRRLREKIEADPSQPSFIKNLRGLGYIWDKECVHNAH